MTARAASDPVTDLLREADAALAACDADRFAAAFADDARLLLLYHEPLEGRSAIHDYWRTFFAQFDASDVCSSAVAWSTSCGATRMERGGSSCS
ncbi:MAG: nuclear transport factor 2 family protein [Candidatus Limnocylindria bacterium]